MALTTVTLHGEILEPGSGTPAVGTVRFSITHELRDVVANIIYAPTTYNVTLDINGEFTLILPATDNPDLVPVDWVYKVWVNTDVWREQFFIQIPFAPGVTEFADLLPLDFDPCAGTLTTTPVTPSEADLFVLKTGDTMTGNLIINANLQVAGDANVDGTLTVPYTGVSLDVAQILTMLLSTSILTGGDLTPNVDPTKIDISALTGFIVDYNSSVALSPTNPTISFVTHPGVTALTPTFAPLNFFLVNSAGVLVQQATRPTPAQRRQNLLVGLTVTEAGTIVVDQTIPVSLSQQANQFADLANSLRPFIEAGALLTANGVNLSINIASGIIFTRSFSQIPTYLDPHTAVMQAQTPMNFRHAAGVGDFTSGVTTILDVANYDPGGLGVVTPVGGGANTSTNFRVWAVANNTANEQVFIQYGQNTYGSLAAAVAGLGLGTYIPNPLTIGAALLGWISVIRTATNLSNTTQAVFTKASKFSTP